MKLHTRHFHILISILLLLTLAACANQTTSQDGTSQYAGAAGMEGTPVVDYVVPRMSANILVDLSGYSTDGRKEAAVKGTQLPETFRLIDADTKTVVLDGPIGEVTYSEELGLYLGYIDFSEFVQPGTYYLECDIIGRSYRFQIGKQLPNQMFEENYDKLMKQCEAGTLPVSEAIVLLMCYEWYQEMFPDQNSNQIPDVLEKLKDLVTHMEATGAEKGEAALYAAFLAKFSYNYQSYDRQYATECVRRAATVFGQVQTAINKDSDNFLALTELYRATGLSTYRNPILEYKSFFEDNDNYLEEAEYLYGIMTYMVTRQRVDVDMCNAFMDGLMARAEEISNHCSDMVHPVTARNNGAQDLMKHAIEVSCVNYIMNNYQYTSVVEEFLHYLMGRNQESVSFYAQDEERARYLLLLAQLAASSPQQE